MSDISQPVTADMRFYNEVPSKALMAALITVIAGFGSLPIAGGFRNGLGGMRADELGLLAVGLIVVAFGLLLARFVFLPRMTLGRHRLRVSNFFGTRSWRYDQIEHLGVLEQRIRPKFYTPGGTAHTSIHEFTIQHLVLKAKHKKAAKLALPHSRDNGELLRRLSLAVGRDVERLDKNASWVPKAWFESTANPSVQDKPEAGLSTAIEADRKTLFEQAIGVPSSLDGRYSSLWVVEWIVDTAGRMPEWTWHVKWAEQYIADILERAYREMGLNPIRTGNRVSTAVPAYVQDVTRDFTQLMDPPRAMPTFYGTKFLAVPELGRAVVPLYGLAAIFQNQTWAECEHASIGHQHDHLDRGVPWLVEEHYKSFFGDDQFDVTLVKAILRTMVWPPFPYQLNDNGEHNLPQFTEFVEQTKVDKSSPELRGVLYRLVACHDLSLSILAGVYACWLQLVPENSNEARLLQRALRHHADLGSLFPSPEAARRFCDRVYELAPRRDALASDVDLPGYRHALQLLDAGKWAAGKEACERLLMHRSNASFYAALGWAEANLGNHDQAFAAYGAALTEDSSHIEAYLNRVRLFAKLGDWDSCDRDLYAVRELDADNQDVRNNLLCTLYNRLDREARERQN
jgi:hypothetical protein